LTNPSSSSTFVRNRHTRRPVPATGRGVATRGGRGCGPGQRETTPGTVLPTPKTPEPTRVTKSPSPSLRSGPIPAAPRTAPRPAGETAPPLAPFPRPEEAAGAEGDSGRADLTAGGLLGSSPRGRPLREQPRPDREGRFLVNPPPPEKASPCARRATNSAIGSPSPASRERGPGG
jgi:hypothetical protein